MPDERIRMGKLCEIDVLGTTYKVYEIERDDEAVMDARGCDGYCDHSTKEIMLRGSFKDPDPKAVANLGYVWDNMIRHEIVHAFLYESGMTGYDSFDGSFYKNEIIVDWFAVQSPKLFKAFKQAGCI